jgi:outer membrane cobalamin receptor
VEIAAGAYTVAASSAGLVADRREIHVADGQPTAIDLAMRLSALTESLVVSAAQIDQPLSRTPDSVTVIPGADLDARQIFTLGAALRTVPGMTVAQSGGPGTLASLFTRGGESDYTLVMVDGVRQNAFGGGLDLSQVPLDNVDRIEVVRGPQSALFGADAIAGVIQVITRSGGTPGARGQVEFGSRQMRRVDGSTSGEINGWRWSAGADYFEDEGYTGLAANGGTVSNDDAQEAQGAGSLGWRHPRSGADVQGSFRHVQTERGTPGAYGSDPAGRFSGVNRIARNLTDRTGWAARWMQPWFGASSRVRQRVEIDGADFDLDNIGGFASSGETARTHVRLQTDVAASAAIGFSAGAEWLGESARSTFITGGGGEIPVERSIAGFFGEGRWNAGDQASITAGVRADRIHRDAMPGDPLAFTPRPDFPADTVISVNPKIAGAYLLGGGSPGAGARAWTRLRGAIGTGIRPPDGFELAFTDNDGLKPERSKSGEIGLTQAVAGGAGQIDATFFVNNHDDLIISVGTAIRGSSRYRTDNISNARARGLELSGAWRAAGLTVQAAYTFLDTEILAVDDSTLAQPPFTVGQPLLRRPRHHGSIDASWTRGPAGAFVQILARGDALDVEPAFGAGGGLYVNPGSAVANLGGSWRIAPWVEIYGRVMNLFDRQYVEVFGYPAPGRTAYLGVRFAAGR